MHVRRRIHALTDHFEAAFSVSSVAEEVICEHTRELKKPSYPDAQDAKSAAKNLSGLVLRDLLSQALGSGIWLGHITSKRMSKELYDQARVHCQAVVDKGPAVVAWAAVESACRYLIAHDEGPNPTQVASPVSCLDCPCQGTPEIQQTLPVCNVDLLFNPEGVWADCGKCETMRMKFTLPVQLGYYCLILYELLELARADPSFDEDKERFHTLQAADNLWSYVGRYPQLQPIFASEVPESAFTDLLPAVLARLILSYGTVSLLAIAKQRVLNFRGSALMFEKMTSF